MNNINHLDADRKRLFWRATHRGTREMDILLGRFAEAHLSQMNSEELTTFANILELPDTDLLNWITKLDRLPPDQDTALMRKLLAADS
jgi:antitoxin CptB